MRGPAEDDCYENSTRLSECENDSNFVLEFTKSAYDKATDSLDSDVKCWAHHLRAW